MLGFLTALLVSADLVLQRFALLGGQRVLALLISAGSAKVVVVMLLRWLDVPDES